MAKKKEHSEWLITKGRLSRYQKEQKRRRLIIIAGSIIVAIVLIVVAIGIYQDYDNDRAPYRQKVLKVNDTSLDMDYYIEMLKVYGVKFQQDPLRSARSVLGNIQQNEVARQLAPTLEITVTDEEVDSRIEEMFTPPDLPDDDGSADNPATPTPVERDYFEEQLDRTGASEEHYRIVFSAEILQQKIAEFANEQAESEVDIPDEMDQAHIWGILFDTSIESGTPTATTDPVITGTAAADSATETLDPKEIRDTIAERLDAGEDFATLFEEFSEPIGGSEDGDLDWGPNELTTLYYGEVVAQVVSEIELGILSDPIPRTQQEGEAYYWVIMVTEREESRPLEEDTKSILESQAINKALAEWNEEQASGFEIDDYQDDPEDDDDIVVTDDDINWAIGKTI